MKRRAALVWSVYVVRCRDGTLYAGVTTDLGRRLRQHNAGRASRYTRGRLPVTLVYSESGLTHGAALRREAAIKALRRSEKERLTGRAA